MESNNRVINSCDISDVFKALCPVKGHFYSVYIPLEAKQSVTEACEYVYNDKVEALKIVKKIKKARFKYFENYNDALNFASLGLLDIVTNDKPQIGNEKPSPFKGPKPQDLVKLRKFIENGDIESFQCTIWDNPRYLVSNGDTPSILQEGFRYNPLHIAAKAKNGKIAELILTTISNHQYIKLLYGNDSFESIDKRMQVLLDLYLNTPDKGLNETPLHFAVKFGASSVVEVLVSFSECDRTLKNKFGQTPNMIICDRCDKDAALIQEIAMHLENNYYVPVLRAEDNSVTPVIGEPFSPGGLPVIQKNPLSPRLEIHAYAGPMNKDDAGKFRKVWKTPPRTSTPIKNASNLSMDSVVCLRYTDPKKGLERLGQKLANKFDVTWKEFWPFLDCFIDISSDEGLLVFEKYLAERVPLAEYTYHSLAFAPSKSIIKKSCSTIADLCLHMQNCQLDDDSIKSDSSFNSFLWVERACNVFAHRIATDICNRINEIFRLQFTFLEIHIKQVELLILSYMEDCRFNTVKFSAMHSRLGFLTAQKLSLLIEKYQKSDFIKLINKFITESANTFDCFSSDDEGKYPIDNKPTSSRKQLICLMQNIVTNLNQEINPPLELENEFACRETWIGIKECTCAYHFKKARKNVGLNRNNSANFYKAGKRNEISKKLLFNNEDFTNNVPVEDSSSDDDFFTPPSSLYNSDSEQDEYSDVQLLSEIFIEGPKPTQTDNAVFKALQLSDCIINPNRFPVVYRWYHNIGLYSEAERKSWLSFRPMEKLEESIYNSPSRQSDSKTFYNTPSSNSWLRITGANSPRTNSQYKTNI